MTLLAFRETARQPVCLLLLTTITLLILLLPLLITHTLDATVRLVTDSALGLIMLGGLLVAGFSAGSSMIRELQSGTALTVLSKPVTRTSFFLAKFAGTGLFGLLFCATTGSALLASRAHGTVYESSYDFPWASMTPCLLVPPTALAIGALLDYLRKKPFVSTALLIQAAIGIPLMAWAGNSQWSILPALLLLAMTTLILAAWAIALASRLNHAATLTLLLVVVLAGSAGDYVATLPLPDALAHLYQALFPNWQVFWAADALHAGLPPKIGYLTAASAYASCCIAIALSAGALVFNKVELK